MTTNEKSEKLKKILTEGEKLKADEHISGVVACEAFNQALTAYQERIKEIFYGE